MDAATGRSGDRIPGKALVTAPVQTGPGVPGVKWPGRGINHPTHLVPRLKKE